MMEYWNNGRKIEAFQAIYPYSYLYTTVFVNYCQFTGVDYIISR